MAIDEKTNRARRAGAVEDRLHGIRHSDDMLLASPVLRFDLVDAHQHPAIADACYEKKQACYAKFNAAKASIPLSADSGNKNLHLVTAVDCASDEIVGSVSIYFRGENAPLPVELAIGKEPQLKLEIERWEGRRIVELSGLWTDDAWRKTGISEKLMLVAFAAARELGAERIVGFSHQHVLGFYGTVGLMPDFRLGQYAYPNADYVSTVVWGDPVGLMTLPVEKRPVVARYAKTIARRKPIMWRNFNEWVSFKP